jgi:glutathione peroxidase
MHKLGGNMSIYDVKIKAADGSTDDLLSQYKGKVTLIANVTGDCGNAPQYAVLETLYQKYKDQGFEVVAVPTNDYCGANLTYGDHVEGTSCATDNEEFGKRVWGVTYNFTELVPSKPQKEDVIPGLPSKYGKAEPHPLFTSILGEHEFMGGNFEKYLIDREGNFIVHFKNGATLNHNYINQNVDPETDGRPIERLKTGARRADVEFKELMEAIESALVA